MVIRARLIACFVVLVTAGHFLAPLFAENQQPAKRPIAVEDLYLFESARSLTVSPDRNRAVYVRSWIDRQSKQQRKSLWLVQGNRENTQAMEAGQPDARAAMFSPDGKWIVFLSTRSRPHGWKQTKPLPPFSEATTDIWLIPGDTGKAIPLAGPDKPYGRVFGDYFYGRMAFSPDGKKLVFVADDPADPRSKQEIAAGVEIVRPDQGELYTGYRNAQVWVAHLDPSPGKFGAARIDRLTDDDVWYGDPQWSVDGKSIVVHANRTSDCESVRYSINKNYDIWSIDVASHKIRPLTDGPGPEVSPRISPDGTRLVFLSVPRKGPHADIYNLATVRFDSSTSQSAGPKMKVLFDHHGKLGQDAPHVPPLFPLPRNCWEDDNHVSINCALGTITRSYLIDLKTAVAQPAKRSTSEARRRLTPSIKSFLSQRLIAPQKVISWDNGEAMKIEGILTVPHESIAKPPYKMVLYPHGGPHSRSTLGFNFTVQVFAAEGYAVFQPNFRGSYGYGKKFLDADRGDFGGGDMRDILSGIDYLVKQGIVDADRQFVYGVSYGGFMTSWLIGHTDQFRAAVPQNAVTDLRVMWGQSDLQSWTEWEFGGYPWQVPDAMRKHSPITYTGNIRTPTLVLHSRNDRRCPLVMGRMFYQSLLSHGVDCKMVVYPDEGHGIRQPLHREDVLRRTLAWFAKYDKKSEK